MIVKYMNKAVWVPFVDGGSPNILLGRDALRALDVNPNDVNNFIDVSVHGFDALTVFHEDDDYLRDANVIGWSIFRETTCFEFMDAATKTLIIYKDLQQFKEAIGG